MNWFLPILSSNKTNIHNAYVYLDTIKWNVAIIFCILLFELNIGICGQTRDSIFISYCIQLEIYREIFLILELKQS